jgi:hypothetical protein
MSKVSQGYSYFRIGRTQLPVHSSNTIPSTSVIEGKLKATVGGGGQSTQWGYTGVTPYFLRNSTLRRTKDILILGRNGWPAGLFTSQWFRPTGTNVVNMALRQRSGPDVSLATTDAPMALGSASFMWDWDQRVLALGSGLRFPEYYDYGEPSLTFIDNPGTTIGNVFKHIVGESELMNTASVALSQGEMYVGGVWSPPENKMGHYFYQVYIANEGGTGKATGTSGTDGNTIAPNIFDSTAYDFSGDVGKFIKVTLATGGCTLGIFEITGFSGNNAVTDADTINEDFTTYAGNDIEWELVTGPIAEYFVRKRVWWHDSTGLSQALSGAGGTTYNGPSLNEFPATGTNAEMCPVSVHDRGAFWWFIRPFNVDDDYGLVRWMHWSPETFDPVYADGDITNMPTGIRNWHDLRMDDQDKLWTCWNIQTYVPDAPDQQKCLARIDPYPGGDSTNPAVTSAGADLFEAQSSVTDATGLCSNHPNGLVFDGSRICVFHDTGTRLGTFQDDGGISYSPDYGTTWKRLHRLHSVTQATGADTPGGTVAVTGDGTFFDTEFAPGDWITFTGDTRSYEIDTIGGATSMNLVTARPSTGNVSIQKGVLTDDQCRLYVSITESGNQAYDDAFNAPPCKADSDGNIYWLPDSRDRVCKFNFSTGTVVEILASAFPSPSMPTLRTLHISKMPGSTIAPTIFHDDIWIGCYTSVAASGGVMRIQKANFDHFGATSTIDAAFVDLGGPINKVQVTSNAHGLENGSEIEITGTTNYNGYFVIEGVTTNTFNIVSAYTAEGAVGNWTVVCTRYNHTLANDFPKTVDVPAIRAYTSAVVTDYASGQIYMFIQEDLGELEHMGVDMYTSDTTTQGQLTDLGHLSRPSATPSAYSNQVIEFDDIGLGQRFVPSLANYTNKQHSSGVMESGPWQCLMWTGAAWEFSAFNQNSVDLAFDGGGSPAGPYGMFTATVGNGLRRVYPGRFELEDNLWLEFEDTDPGSVIQDDQFLQDEAFTFPVCTGLVKDNISEAQWNVHVHSTPTVHRVNSEPIVDTLNMWSLDGGQDGGWTNSADTTLAVEFERGVAEFHDLPMRDASTPLYDNFYDSNNNVNNPANLQLVVGLRIPDELTFPHADGTIAASTVFTATFDFTNYVGYSIFIDDATNAADNGQAVIQTGGVNTCTVDKTFVGSEGTLTWHLKDVPAVGFVRS